MREVNLAAVDLNLLPPLEALLRRRNVTRAAADAGLSQPAMSRALGRLRDLLDDPLLVRQGGGFILTPFAEALAPQLATALGEVQGLFSRPAFDPRGETRTIRMVASDIHTVLLIPPLMARLAAQAPGVALRIAAYSPELPDRVARGEVDLTFAVTGAPSRVKATTIRPSRAFRSASEVARHKIAITSEATTMLKPSSRGKPLAGPPSETTMSRSARSFMSTTRFQVTLRTSMSSVLPWWMWLSSSAASRQR